MQHNGKREHLEPHTHTLTRLTQSKGYSNDCRGVGRLGWAAIWIKSPFNLWPGECCVFSIINSKERHFLPDRHPPPKHTRTHTQTHTQSIRLSMGGHRKIQLLLKWTKWFNLQRQPVLANVSQTWRAMQIEN